MAQACDANSLAALYAPLAGIPSGAQMPIMLALLCKIAAMPTCDAQTLTNLATCDLCAIPVGMQMPIAIALLCEIANNGGGGGGGGVTSIVAGQSISISPAGGTGAVTINQPTFTSGLFTLSQDSWVIPHGLGAVPTMIFAVLHCVVNDVASGMTAGQEISVAAFQNSNDNQSAFSIGNDGGANILVGCDGTPVGAEGSFPFTAPTGGSVNVSNFNNFRLKVYAKL